MMNTLFGHRNHFYWKMVLSFESISRIVKDIKNINVLSSDVFMLKTTLTVDAQLLQSIFVFLIVLPLLSLSFSLLSYLY